MPDRDYGFTGGNSTQRGGTYGMDFREVEARFRELKSKLDAGAIGEEECEAELRKLYVVDGEGRYWMMGAQTAQWYYHDGSEWIQAQSPEQEMQPPDEVSDVSAPPSPLVEPAGATPAPPARSKASRAILVVIGLAALCCIFGASAVAISELVLPGKPISSFVSSLRTRTVATPTTVRPLEPSPTAGLSADEYIRAGDRLFGDERFEEAIAQYQMAISVDPQNAEAYARLGEAYVRLGACEQAVPEFQQALTLNPELESAQAGLMECGGVLPPDLAFASYSRSDLNFSLVYPSAWAIREEQLQTIFAERLEDIDALRGNIFFISSLPLEPDEEDLDDMGALQRAIQLITLPVGSQLGGVELASFAGQEWATVQGEIVGLQTPTTIYIAATVKGTNWYGIWAVGATETWEQSSWPVFRVMAGSVKLEEVVALASPTVITPTVGVTPSPTSRPSPQVSPTSRAATPTPSLPAATPTRSLPAPTPTPRKPTLAGKIAYPVYVGGEYRYQIRVADVSGNVLATFDQASEPALAPDGNRIAYRSWDKDYRGMVTVGLDGANRQRPRGGEAPNEDSLPRWSADGTSLVYATKRFPHRVSHVFTHVLASGSERDLGEGDNPDWSADSLHIVARTSGLVVVDAGGGSPRQLTSSNGDYSPDWSPSGDKIAFMRWSDGDWDIWVINRDGSGETELTTDPSVDGLPAWSPDGASIAFLSNRGGAWAIWVMNADGSEERKLFDTGSATYATSEGFDGEFAGKVNWQRRDWLDEQISWSR